MSLVAAITAGGRVEGALQAALGTPVKALARIGERTLLDTAILAARGAGAARVVVVGGSEVRAHCSEAVDTVIDESSDGRENLRRALLAAGDAPLLLLTSDLPFVNPHALGQFLVGARGSDVAMPLARRDAYLTTFPGAPPHDVDVGGERVVNGSAFAFAPGAAPRVVEIALRLFAARKSLLGMASLLGPALLARFALGRLRIADVEARAQVKLGLAARAVRDASPELCYDIDTIDDYRYAVTRHSG